ncbi:hypothetical protein SYNPS1DRAFT_21686 [Syncephalis pseudoplumigaleata]|uniref:Uncharacterized protein n=1 Tax=Syncephalis pseudoplumigaleata TaxID=1712513 RepID=A0A4P9Z246_9FUNG|nr:hypothetical protein SYNPS1DRAFT_21686 [Syncephalis pseudoplumigaleata]|eukprot:RKP26587.1 hypothetical protein SYNPS1DRAFT_21686 [Syncephalis pseudoplumigaleata]
MVQHPASRTIGYARHDDNNNDDSDTTTADEAEEPLTLATARTPGQKAYVLTRDHILLPFVHGFFWGMAANIYRWIFMRWTRGQGARVPSGHSKRHKLGQHIERQAEGTGLGVGLGAM